MIGLRQEAKEVDVTNRKKVHKDTAAYEYVQSEDGDIRLQKIFEFLLSYDLGMEEKKDCICQINTGATLLRGYCQKAMAQLTRV